MKDQSPTTVGRVVKKYCLLMALVVAGLWCTGSEAVALKCATQGATRNLCSSSLSKPSQVNLDLSRRTTRPGGTLKLRIENDSMEDIEYGRAVSLQRYERGRWVRLPEKQVLDVGLVVRAGSASAWQSIHVPADALPGRYRVRKIVTPIDVRAAQPIPLLAYFRACEA